MLGVILTAIIFGLPVFGAPAAAVSYCLIVVGRRAAGVSGMKLARIGSVFLTVVPLVMCLIALMEWLSFDGSRYPDQIKGVLLFGSMAFSASLGVSAIMFFCWHDQVAKTQ